MYIYSENVKFIVVNLKEDVVKIYFYHNFFQIDYDKFSDFTLGI